MPKAIFVLVLAYIAKSLWSLSDPKITKFLVKDKTNKSHIVATKVEKGKIVLKRYYNNKTKNVTKAPEEHADYKLGKEHYDDIEEVMGEMFAKEFLTGSDYSLGQDPDIETFIIQEEQSIMQGCRLSFW